ncbi:MAG: hypothetical protein N2490_03795 [Ignavibacteria bacterium]|nr:hypothetical protein [Ignavibacteria bacterium]
MKEYNIIFYDSLPFIEENGNIIFIDTGAPLTIHKTNELSFNSNTYQCVTQFFGTTVESLSELIGKELTTLMGIDILSNYYVLFDYRNKVVKFSEKEIDFDGKEIKFIKTYFFMMEITVPLVEFKVDNVPLKLHIDTGAKISYLAEEITKKYPSIGVEKDYHPAYGGFETNCYNIITSLGDDEFLVKYGNLPDVLNLFLGNANGVIGYDLFNNFLILFDFKNKILKYRKY